MTSASASQSVQGQLDLSKLFFILSGEHETLPQAEVEAILESSGLPFAVEKKSYRLLILESPKEALKAVSERSLMFDSCGHVLGECEAESKAIYSFLKEFPLENMLSAAKSFAVRSVRLGGSRRQLRRVDLEREIGSVVKERLPRLTVHLTRPDVTLICLLYANSFVFGLSGFLKPSGLIAPRLPRKRPVFHPSTMPPKIARCMVNLARARAGVSFADPFSGVGGIALEAATIGCKVVAIDANQRMIRGVRRNLKHFGFEPLGLLNADARQLPLHGLDAIATDPPYGRGSSTMGVRMSSLVKDFISNVRSSLKTGMHMCISAPEDVQLREYAEEAGFRVRERHLAKVHRSLTRQFVVLRNE